jgi:TPR repeat protein
VVLKVIQEISNPNNVYFEEELDALIKDIENHEEAIIKLLGLFKHRSLSVAEVKIIKSQMTKLTSVVDERRKEIKSKVHSESPSDFFHSASNNHQRNNKFSSIASSGESPTTLPSPSQPAPVNVGRKLPTPPSVSSSCLMNTRRLVAGYDYDDSHNNALVASSLNLHNHNHNHVHESGMEGAGQGLAFALMESRNGDIAKNINLENYELSPQLLNRLLKGGNEHPLNQDDIILKTRLLDSMILSSNDVEITKTRVGRGSFGDVCLGTLRNRYKIAIKTLKRSNDLRKDEQRIRLIEKEMLVVKYLGSYPTIPVCYGYVMNDDCFQVVLELAPYGSLSLILKDNSSFPIIPVALKIGWLSDLADAVRFLHSKEIMHKNISADNLLVFEKLRVKLGDFGPEKGKARSDGDVKAYLAPEVREGKNPEYGSDVYSYSMTAIQIFARRVPHLERPEEQLIAAIDKEWIQPVESKDALICFLGNAVKYDENVHVNETRPSADDLFQEILSVLETLGGDPREEISSHDYFVVSELEAMAKQKRNEMLRAKSSYKSNLALKPNNTAVLQNSLSRRSMNLANLSSYLGIRNGSPSASPANVPASSSNRFSMNAANITSFSYSQFQQANGEERGSGSAVNDFLSNSIDIEDKASIAYFLIQAARFTPLEADFMADRLVRKGVSCVSTLRRKLHRDSEYLLSIGVDPETAKRISAAIFSIKSPLPNLGASPSSSAGANNGRSASPVGFAITKEVQQSRKKGLQKKLSSFSFKAMNKTGNCSFLSASSFLPYPTSNNQHQPQNVKMNHQQAPFKNRAASSLLLMENEGNTDLDNDESDSLESSSDYKMKDRRNPQNKKKGKSQQSAVVKAMTAQDEEDGCLANDREEEIVDYNEEGAINKDLNLQPDDTARRLLSDTKHLMERRNVLSKFLRVEINLSPDLANKYTDILISRDIYDLFTLQKRMLNDSNILIKYGFDKKISNLIFDQVTNASIMAKFSEEHRVNNIDMSLQNVMIPSSVVSQSAIVYDNKVTNQHQHNSGNGRDSYSSASSATSSPSFSSSSGNGDLSPNDIAKLYYDASQSSNADALERLLETAENGDYLAQGFLMRMYALGQGDVKADMVVAQEMGSKLFPWLQHAIQSESGASSQLIMYARYLVGVCYSLGLGASKNEGEGIRWYMQSAHQGYIGAQAYLGYCYYLGVGVEKNLKEAYNWYKISALRGHSASQCNLGLCYEYGHGTDKNIIEAVKWYRASSDQGDAIASFSLGNIYEKGKKGIPQNFKESFKYYKIAAERGYDSAQYSLGCCFYAGLGVEQNLNEAFRWFNVASQSGNASSQCKVGFCYENGLGIEKDETKAIEFYRLSAIQEHPAACYYLGYAYFIGMGGLQADVREAVRLYEISAAKRYAAAQNNLGFCYFNGIGVKKDLSKAIEWYRLAANQDYPAAQFNLAYCYEKGLGIPCASVEESTTWYQKAAKNGHTRARKALKRLNDSE